MYSSDRPARAPRLLDPMGVAPSPRSTADKSALASTQGGQTLFRSRPPPDPRFFSNVDPRARTRTTTIDPPTGTAPYLDLTSPVKALYLARPVTAAVDLKDIKAIIDLMKKNDLSVFELEKDGIKLKLVKGSQGPVLTTPIALAPGIGGAAPAAATPGAAKPEGAVAASEKAPSGSPLKDITSPMVGTFYRSPSPEAAAFVDVGATVNEDTVVCIIEAMKVMNEIKAETSGVIAEIMVENGKPVQFGQALFKVR